MKKSIFFLSVLVFFAFAPQSNAQNDCGDNARSYVNANITTNGIRAITGAKMNVALNKIIDAIICRDSLATILQDSLTIEIEDDSILSFTIFGQTVKDTIRNVGGGGGIVTPIDTVAVTYSEFYSLITSNQLIGGNTYILMDFQTVYDQMDFDNSGNLKPTLVTKTGAIEQIWVLALSSNQIADKAYSATYPNDEIQYDWTYNTTLVNGAPAKGRISERIDEWNNRTDYDHREIKFIRYDDGAGNFTVINDNGNASQEFLTFGNNYGAGGIIHDNWLGDFYSIGQFFGQEYSNNVFQGGFIMSNKITSVFYNNTSLSDFIVNVFLNETTRCIFGGTAFSGNLVSGGFYDVSLTNGSVSNSLFNGYFTNIQFNGAGVNNLNSFEGIFENIVFDCIVSSCTFNNVVENTTFTGTNLKFTNVYGRISGKTIDDVTYPNLFGTYYEKKIFNASDNNVYFRYFDGTNDVNTLIP